MTAGLNDVVPTTPSTAPDSSAHVGAPGKRLSGATVHGYPRQGRDRQLKPALERYWRGAFDITELLTVAAQVRAERWEKLVAAGLDEVPVGDFSLYDHMLDAACLFDAVPERHRSVMPRVETDQDWWERYFAMARGTAEAAPLEMTKWFDTNYHYLVPELTGETTFGLRPDRLLAEITDAQSYGRPVRPVLVGPITFLRLSKAVGGQDEIDSDAVTGVDCLTLLNRLLPRYVELLSLLSAAGVEWVQLDEPVAVTDLSDDEMRALGQAYRELTAWTDRPKLLVGTYFGPLGSAAPVLVGSGIEGLAVDLTERGAGNLHTLAGLPQLRSMRLVAGVVDGRNVWRTGLRGALASAAALLGSAARVDVAASCSLLHVPHDVTRETGLDPQVASWLAFADQKLDEVVLVARGLSNGLEAIEDALIDNDARLETRRSSALVTNPAVQSRLSAVRAADLHRRSSYRARSIQQRERLRLPPLPTTTIGSFPQTGQLRRARAELRAGRLDASAYQAAMRAEIDRVIDFQTTVGLDVLVHGEPERNDMVQYFAEQLDGVVTTEHGWVQSYGSRYVRPPIIAGDISRPTPMTVDWSRYAQSRTSTPVKGMLTGPVTMLAWSFVRDDQPRAATTQQMALALRDEVLDLESAHIAIIQVDEPALRETLPLRTADQADYLSWAVEAFQLTTCGVADATQIHTHMCYAEFGAILAAISAMDADVISLEAARSRMHIVTDLDRTDYPRQVGPGVWDIHSPRIPSVEEMTENLRLALDRLPLERLWVNPDCGLKTRGWPEVTQSLSNLTAAATRLRQEILSTEDTHQNGPVRAMPRPR